MQGEIKGENYKVWTEDGTTVNFQGSLRLGSPAEYEPLTQLLDEVTDREPPIITLNLKELEFLNSSGINMLSKFAINLRKKKTIQVVILGSKDIPWQGKSLKNLQRLVPGLKLDLE